MTSSTTNSIRQKNDDFDQQSNLYADPNRKNSNRTLDLIFYDNTCDDIHTKVDMVIKSNVQSFNSDIELNNHLFNFPINNSNKNDDTIDEKKKDKQYLHDISKEVHKEKGLSHESSPVNLFDDQIIKNLRHDLRNSLHPIVNLLPILYSTSNVDQNEKVIQVLHRNMENLQNLVEKSILLTQVKSKSILYNPSTFPVSVVFDEILSEKKQCIQKKQLQILKEGDEQTYLTYDFFYLKQAINNIIDNAICFTPFDGMIFIRIQRKKDWLHVSIRDTGIGMEPMQVQHVFDEFYKVDESRHDLSSNGLGLSISKYIIERMGGTIGIESPGKNLEQRSI